MTWEAKARMRQIGEAARKAARHRRWDWCRHWNGFSDMPLWRLIASRLQLPAYQVVAFVVRLDEFANAAEQRGGLRGAVDDFSAEEFGVALGMPAEDAARIFAALEHPDIGWIAFGHLATFYDRNRDSDDDRDKAAERKRRQRERDRAMKELALAAAAGTVSADERRAREAALLLDHRLSTRLTVADETTGHNVTDASNVTVTQEQSTGLRPEPVDKSADTAGKGTSGETAGPTGQASGKSGADLSTSPVAARETVADETTSRCDVVADETVAATRWLETEGARIVCERMVVHTNRAAQLVGRWQRDLADPHVLVDAILGADHAGLTAGRFHVSVTDAIGRHLRAAALGQPLPLRPVPIGPAVPMKRSESQDAQQTDEAPPAGVRKLAG